MTVVTVDQLKHLLLAYRSRRLQGVDAFIARRLAIVEHATTFGLTVIEANARLDFLLLKRKKFIVPVIH